jgi:equilibrative nucleoside transporter 1/2/3
VGLVDSTFFGARSKVLTLISRNMFLAAAPYFQSRFATNDWLLAQFQPSILAVSSITSLVFTLILTKLQLGANYPRRIVVALTLNTVAFTLLAISTRVFLDVSAGGYFVFLLVMVLLSSTATSFMQNGLFAFVSGFDQQYYTQGIMTGQGIAGVLPPIVQIATVLGMPEGKSEVSKGESYRSAFVYFLTATGVSLVTLLAFWVLARKHPEAGVGKKTIQSIEEAEELDQDERKDIPLLQLFFKLKWFALGVFATFAITMFFPVFTQAIVSVSDPETAPRIFRPECFIPLSFLVWNSGDLIGRVLPSFKVFNATHLPKPVFFASLARFIWIPLYMLCNVNGKGAVIESDVFYLLAVQLLFGMSNGHLGSTCMMAAPQWVDDNEKEAAGGFMGLMLVSGLTLGSLLSFGAARA